MFGLILTFLSCAGSVGATRSAVDAPIHAPAPTPEGRLSSALDAAPVRDVNLTLAAQFDMQERPVTVLADAPSKVGGLPDNVTVKPLLTSERTPLFWDKDERPFIEALAAEAPDFLLLRRDVAPSVDRGRAVASRKTSRQRRGRRP